MKVLLLQHIKKLGQKGDVIEVSDGYANSFLIPRKLVKVATGNKEQVVRNIEKKKQEQDAALEQFNRDLFKRLNKKKITIVSPANQNGQLFGGVGKPEIGQALPGLRAEHIILKTSIKEIGEHEIPIRIGENKGAIIANVTGQ